MTTNRERAAEIIRDARLTTPVYRDGQDHITPATVDRLADAGLITPDHPAVDAGQGRTQRTGGSMTNDPFDKKTIWKFTIPITDQVDIMMPGYVKFLPFIKPGSTPATLDLYAEVHPDIEPAMRRFHVVGTGNPMPLVQNNGYIGSVTDGPFVWHVYEGLHP